MTPLEAPVPEIDDPHWGRLTWSALDESWIGVRNGVRFALSRDKAPMPTPELLAYASEVIADPKWLLADFEQEKEKWRLRVPANRRDELEALRIGTIHFSLRNGRRFIFADVDGGHDGRCWRIMWLDRQCDGLGFDT